MPQLPALKCGGSLQYPASRTIRYQTNVTRFLDGSEQRFRERRAPGLHWSSKLTLLDESEARGLTQFFEGRAGQFGTFSFTDPFDGVQYTSCRFTAGSLNRRQDDEAQFTVSLDIEASNI